MGRVSFDDNRAAGGKGRGCVAASDRECERKVRCSEYGDRTESNVSQSKVRFSNRLAVSVGRIEAKLLKLAVADLFREQAQLSGSSGAFTFDPCARQASFVHRSQDKVVAE